MTALPLTALAPADIVALMLIFVLFSLCAYCLHSRAVNRTKAKAFEVIEFIVDAKKANESTSRLPVNFSLAVLWAPIARQFKGRDGP